jgi:hypothetical protein
MLAMVFAVLSGCSDDERPAADSSGDALTVDAGDDCSQDALSGGDDEFAFTSAYRVVDGQLESLCLGADDPVVRAAWADLEAISPPSQLGDLAVFGGFEPDGSEATETFAFVSVLDTEGSQFQMAINVAEAQADPDELLLTLAHEFSHVFTATSTQLNRSDEAIDTCATYFNGEGCYADGALMTNWIERFWSDPMLDGVDPLEDSADGADARCALDDGFFGSYAATNPEEDFAEAFSAFVFGLDPETKGQAARLDWLAGQPGLVEFRTRADAAALTPMENRFEICGP